MQRVNESRFVPWEDGGKLKINHAKTAVGLPVSHVANVRVVMVNAVSFQLGEQFPRPFGIQVFNPISTIRRDDPRFCWIGFEQPGNKSTTALFQMAQHFHLLVKSGQRIPTMVNLEHPSVETQVYCRPKRILHLQHTREILPRFRRLATGEFYEP